MLRGGLNCEIGCQAVGWIRGRINRLWTVHVRYDSPPDPNV